MTDNTNGMDKLFKHRQELLSQIDELCRIRSHEMGKMMKRSHNCRTMEEREALTPELLAKSQEISQQLESVYVDLAMIDETIIHDLIKGDKS